MDLVNLLDLKMLQSTNENSDDDDEEVAVGNERSHKYGDAADGAVELSLSSQFRLRFHKNLSYNCYAWLLCHCRSINAFTSAICITTML